MFVFLGLNGLDLDAPQEAVATIVLGVAAKEITEDSLVRWIADHIKPLHAPAVAP